MAFADVSCPRLTVHCIISGESSTMSAKSSEDVHKDMTREVSNAEASPSPLTERMAPVSKSAHR